MKNSSSPDPERPRGKGGWLAFTIVGGTAGLFLACCGPCILLGLLDARNKARQQAADEAEPELRQAAKVEGRPHPVGFRRMEFDYQVGEGPKVERKFLLWYPTTGTVKPFNYLDLKGFATPDGPVAPGRHPLILFSHGYRGAGAQTIFLMEAFAREGYVVAAIDHADAMTRKQDKPTDLGIFFDVKSWSSRRFRDRRDDLSSLLDHLLALDADEKSFLHAHVNGKSIGAAGHSLGGYTVMGAVGGWPDWTEPRIGAALLLSPYTLPFTSSLKKVKVPVMLQGGTLDFGITPFLQATYDGLPGPKYYLVLKNATHFEWTNLITGGRTTAELVKQGNARLMTEYSIAFFNAHLRGEEEPLLQRAAAGLESYQFSVNRKP